MKFNKNHIYLIILNVICFACFVGYLVILLNSQNLSFLTILSSVMFLIPYFVSLVFSLLFFKKNSFGQDKHCGLTTMQWSIGVLSIICLVISVFFLIYSIIGINSMNESINGIMDGYIYSDIYTKEQLLDFSKTGLSKNIFSLVSTCLFAIGCAWSSISLFKKSKQ